MMLNREQAGATWCPMVRMSLRNADARARDRVPASSCCIADQCAMWRWVEPEPQPRDARTWWPDEDEPTAEPPRTGEVPIDAVWVPITGEGEDMQGGCWEESQQAVDAENVVAAATRRGYCGLGGAPAATSGGRR